MRLFGRIFISISVATLVITTGLSQATLLVKQFSTQEITQRADCVAMGIVTDVNFITENNQVYTVTDIQCDRVFKGNVDEKSIQVIQLGGKTDRYTRAVYGAPSYAVDEEVILFMENNKYQKTLKRVIGMSMGKYSIIEDPDTGEKYAVSDQSELHFVQPVQDPFASRLVKKPLDEFIAEIQQAVEQTSALNQSNTSTQTPDKDFDWIKYIQKLIIDFANNMADKYYTVTTQRTAGNEKE